ncbi:MAG: ABC transporter permease, partial [Cyanobacteria bacterium P01_C01_bin.38]
MLNSIDKIGDWNPQLLRELKGRLKPFPVIIAIVTSLATQLIIFLYQLREIPDLQSKNNIDIEDKYCNLTNTVKDQYSSWISCPPNQINMQLWWQDHWEYMFRSLGMIFIFTLLMAGAYLIINDLSQEERKGTLNFIRLSPQSETSIFTGKMLGVPVLIYLTVFAAIPFHILTGINGNLAFGNILCFYLILVASCIFFYSYALLFGVFGGSVLSGFKPWLGSGFVFLVLLFSMQLFSYGNSDDLVNCMGFAALLSPTTIADYFFPGFLSNQTPALQELQFFNFAVGKSFIGVIALHLLNYALWTYWAWQGLKRCFRNPNATIFSKQQSYLIFASFQIVLIGLLVSIDYTNNDGIDWGSFSQSVFALYMWNLLMIAPLFALMLTHRQAIQDWARFRLYRNENSTANSNKSLLSELISGEKSPAILAFAINLLIAVSAVIILYFQVNIDSLHSTENFVKLNGALLVAVSLIMIYATAAQIMLMLKNSKRVLWAAGTASALIILPPLVLGVLNVDSHNMLWLFTILFCPTAQYCTSPEIFTAFVCQVVIFGFLNWYLIKQVRKAGESATKAM